VLREIVTIAAFLFILAGLVSALVIIQKAGEHQIIQVEKLLEEANEVY
jgi:hypothetical protein